MILKTKFYLNTEFSLFLLYKSLWLYPAQENILALKRIKMLFWIHGLPSFYYKAVLNGKVYGQPVTICRSVHERQGIDSAIKLPLYGRMSYSRVNPYNIFKIVANPKKGDAMNYINGLLHIKWRCKYRISKDIDEYKANY